MSMATEQRVDQQIREYKRDYIQDPQEKLGKSYYEVNDISPIN